jgi:hypothetical protein
VRPSCTSYTGGSTRGLASDAAGDVNDHLSTGVVAVLLETREEKNEIDYSELPPPAGPWFLVRFTTVSEDVRAWFLPGDHTVAADESNSLVAYSVRAGFDAIVDRRHVETVTL